MFARRILSITILLSWLLAACSGSPDTRSSSSESATQSSGEKSTAETIVPPAPASSLAGFDVAGMHFDPPVGWRDLGPSGMRAAQFRLDAIQEDPAPAEVNVFYFGGGQGGDVESNIRRWISQITLPAGGSAASTAIRSQLRTEEMTVHFVEVNGTYAAAMGPMTGRKVGKEGYRLVGAIVEGPRGNIFFKLVGPEKTARAMEVGLREMVKAARKS